MLCEFHLNKEEREGVREGGRKERGAWGVFPLPRSVLKSDASDSGRTESALTGERASQGHLVPLWGQVSWEGQGTVHRAGTPLLRHRDWVVGLVSHLRLEVPLSHSLAKFPWTSRLSSLNFLVVICTRRLQIPTPQGCCRDHVR